MGTTMVGRLKDDGRGCTVFHGVTTGENKCPAAGEGGTVGVGTAGGAVAGGTNGVAEELEDRVGVGCHAGEGWHAITAANGVPCDKVEVPMGQAITPELVDEALSRVVIDFSGRPGLEYRVSFPRSRIGEFDVDLFHEFFQGFVNHAKATLHIDCLRGVNAHHIAETAFKAFGRALRMAVEADPRMAGMMPSTKGSL